MCHVNKLCNYTRFFYLHAQKELACKFLQLVTQVFQYTYSYVVDLLELLSHLKFGENLLEVSALPMY